MKPVLLLLAAASVFAIGVNGARAETVSLAAQLLGSSEVPATGSDAFADAQFSYDSATHRLQYYVNYDGVAPAKVDLHGPAAAGEKAASLLDISLSPSPISGAVTLTAEQGNELLAGKIYLDIHSRKYLAGEIRGQIVRQSRRD